jgi:hypothetical protein
MALLLSQSRQRVLAVLSAEKPSKAEVLAAAFAYTPDDLRGSLWKLLLDYYPLERSERQALVRQRRHEYLKVYLPASQDVRGRSSGSAGAGASPSPPPAEGLPPPPPSPPRSPPPRAGGAAAPAALSSPHLFGSPSVVGVIESSAYAAAALLAGAGGGEGGGGARPVSPPLFDDADAAAMGAAHTFAPGMGAAAVAAAADAVAAAEAAAAVAAEAPAPLPEHLVDAELRAEILKDVERTYPEMAFFCQPEHAAAMARILLVYAKLNAGVRYIQGMNELLAPLLYVCAGDRSHEVAGVAPPGGLDDVEADAFFLFCGLMTDRRDVFIQEQDNSSSGIRGQLDAFGRALAAHEPAVAEHLMSMGLLPQFYALRWLTALCCRELCFPDALSLWDKLLADSPRCAFLTPFCVALVRSAREPLLAAGFGEAMKMLQQPASDDFGALMACALGVRAEAAEGARGGGGARHAGDAESSHGAGGAGDPLSRENSWAPEPSEHAARYFGGGGGGGGAEAAAAAAAALKRLGGGLASAWSSLRSSMEGGGKGR